MKEKIQMGIEDYICNYCNENNIDMIWKNPIVKYANANDPKIPELKKIVVDNHFVPSDFLENPTTIISYFLPFKEDVAKSNLDGIEASSVWANAYITTNEMAIHLNNYIVDMVQSLGYIASSPTNIGIISNEILMSRWSQRHIAHIAGHGTFGINNMLISEEGCCGRYFSVITNLPVKIDKIVEVERCLYKSTGKCGVCVKRCVTDALTIDGFSREKCFVMCLENERKYKTASVCGKCVVGLPCSFSSLQ